MIKEPWMRPLAAIGVIAALAFARESRAETGEFTPTGQFITPRAAPGAVFQSLNPNIADDPSYVAGQASATALSPDGRTLLILTSGYNLMFSADGKPNPRLSQEYVFVFDVSGPSPVQMQAIRIPNTFLGLAWAPDGRRFFASGGVDDVVYEFARADAGYAPARTFSLGHKRGVGLAVKPSAGAVAVSPDGRRLLVANFQNDSVSVIDLSTGTIAETDLRPAPSRRPAAASPEAAFPARSSGRARPGPTWRASAIGRSSRWI